MCTAERPHKHTHTICWQLVAQKKSKPNPTNVREKRTQNIQRRCAVQTYQCASYDLSCLRCLTTLPPNGAGRVRALQRSNLLFCEGFCGPELFRKHVCRGGKARWWMIDGCWFSPPLFPIAGSHTALHIGNGVYAKDPASCNANVHSTTTSSEVMLETVVKKGPNAFHTRTHTDHSISGSCNCKWMEKHGPLGCDV